MYKSSYRLNGDRGVSSLYINTMNTGEQMQVIFSSTDFTQSTLKTLNISCVLCSYIENTTCPKLFEQAFRNCSDACRIMVSI